jgi:hypothetical protein
MDEDVEDVLLCVGVMFVVVVDPRYLRPSPFEEVRAGVGVVFVLLFSGSLQTMCSVRAPHSPNTSLRDRWS